MVGIAEGHDALVKPGGFLIRHRHLGHDLHRAGMSPVNARQVADVAADSVIPKTTKKINYIVGSTLIFSKASETNSIAVKEAKNSFDFDWKR